MSAATATADAAVPPKPGKAGRKKLVLILALVLLLLAGGGAAAVYVLKRNAAAAAAAADEAEGDAAPAQPAAAGRRAPPSFVPLEPFVVNLADRDGERFAQIGLTLEVDDAKFGDEMKQFMPAVRNAILMILAHKSSQELLAREGKQALAEEIMREAVRPMGIEIDPPAVRAEAAGGDEPAAKPARKGAAKKRPTVHNPVQRVHFSSFIIQ